MRDEIVALFMEQLGFFDYVLDVRERQLIDILIVMQRSNNQRNFCYASTGVFLETLNYVKSIYR